METRNTCCVVEEMPEIKITSLGALGDGLGRLSDGTPVFVPFTLAGETVKAGGAPPHFDLEQIITPSDDRREPPCPHFGSCGGCSVQHLTETAYLAWKRDIVQSAFNKAGIKTEIQPTIASPAHSRRRAVLTAQRQSGDDGSFIALGFSARASGSLVDLSVCHILEPALVDAFASLRDLAATLLRGDESLQMLVTRFANGIDVDVRLEQEPNEEMTAAFVRGFARTPFLRASFDGAIVVENAKPIARFGNAEVAVPPGGFLQAVEQAEDHMARMVCAHLKKTKRIVDLFCGSGTFALRLAQFAKVHGVEKEARPLDALKSVAGDASRNPVTTEIRDLHQLPLTDKELKRFDGICLDPPRAGAEEQIGEISRSDVSKIAYVSCNPTTLARDAAHLIDNGFSLERVTPVDQFVWSHHVEVVALFSRSKPKKPRSIFR